MSANESSDKRKEGMKSKISSKIPKLKAATIQFTETILLDKYLDINQNIYDILNEIEELEKTCVKLVDKSKKIQEF